MTISPEKVTVVIPTLNESETVSHVIEQLKTEGYHNIVVIDGHSTDGTVEVVKKLGATVILQDKRGKGAALRQAFSHESVNGDIVAIIDADGSMDPKEIPLFLKAMDDDVDLVKGSRFMLGGYSQDINLVRKIGNYMFLSLVNLLWSTQYTDLCYGFGAFKKEALKKLSIGLNSMNFEIETEICIKAKKLGLNFVEVPSVELRRRHGKSNLSIIRDGIKILRTILKEFLDRRQ